MTGAGRLTLVSGDVESGQLVLSRNREGRFQIKTGKCDSAFEQSGDSGMPDDRRRVG